jgi:hypothetical protein
VRSDLSGFNEGLFGSKDGRLFDDDVKVEDDGSLDEFGFALDNPLPEEDDEVMPEVPMSVRNQIKASISEGLETMNAAIFFHMNGPIIMIDPLADPAVAFTRLITYNQFLVRFNLTKYTTTDRVVDPSAKEIMPPGVVDATLKIFMSAGYLSRTRSRTTVESFDFKEMITAGRAAYHLLTSLLERRKAMEDPKAQMTAPATLEATKRLVKEATGVPVEDINRLRQEADAQRVRVAQLEDQLRFTTIAMEAATRRTVATRRTPPRTIWSVWSRRRPASLSKISIVCVRNLMLGRPGFANWRNSSDQRRSQWKRRFDEL